jgi:type IV secretion system protein VirD4
LAPLRCDQCIKGELFVQTAGYRATIGKVFVFDPTGVGNRFDPLNGKHTDLELKSVAKNLLYESDERDKVFTQRATRMLTQLFHAARMEQVSPLRYVGTMINAPIKVVATRLAMLSPQLAIRFLDDYIEDADFQNKFLSSGWSTLTSRLDALLAESLVRCFTGNDFAPRELLCPEASITVYLRWPEKDLLVLVPLIRLMWGTLIDELTAIYDDAKGVNCQPVLLLIDEAGRTAIPSLADHATTVVGRGISLWIAVQSLSQLNVVYGTQRATILRDNMDSRVFYRPNDQETAEYLECCLGRKSDFAHSQTIRDGEQTSEGRMEQGILLLTAQEIKQMPDEQIIDFHRQLPPFLGTRMDWRRFLVLKERQAMPPPELSPLPNLAETIPVLTPQNNGHLTGFIDPDMTG